MPSSVLYANPRSLTPNLFRSLHSYGKTNKTQLQISKDFLGFSIANRNPVVNCRGGPILFVRSYSKTAGGKSLDAESRVEGGLGDEVAAEVADGGGSRLNVEAGTPNVPAHLHSSKMSLGDQAFFLLAFVACTAMGRAATSLAKLADTAREELPSTMAAIRLSGMEISDLTLELSDLSVRWGRVEDLDRRNDGRRSLNRYQDGDRDGMGSFGGSHHYSESNLKLC
ncbi:hypothetical protein ACLOJK_001750 [Asimina triloba]